MTSLTAAELCAAAQHATGQGQYQDADMAPGLELQLAGGHGAAPPSSAVPTALTTAAAMLPLDEGQQAAPAAPAGPASSAPGPACGGAPAWLHAQPAPLRVVVLSPDAAEPLPDAPLDPHALYVIGGIVDRSVQKGITTRYAVSGHAAACRAIDGGPTLLAEAMAGFTSLMNASCCGRCVRLPVCRLPVLRTACCAHCTALHCSPSAGRAGLGVRPPARVRACGRTGHGQRHQQAVGG